MFISKIIFLIILYLFPEPNCEYVISLKARNEVGDGPPVYSNVRTREEAPLETSSPLVPPVGLKAVVLSSNAVVVYWTDTTLSKSQVCHIKIVI